MNCAKCGKEIPEGENRICEECQKELISGIATSETEEKSAKTKKENKIKKEGKSFKFKITKEDSKKQELIKLVALISIVAFVIVLAMILINNISSGNEGNTIGNIRNYGYAAEDGGWIYYIAPNEDSTQIGIFKTKEGKKGYEPKQLIMSELNILSLNVYKNYVYFIGVSSEVYSEDDEVDNKIYRMKKDGSDLQVINDNNFNNNCYEIYVINNSIYYLGTDNNIYKMKSDGSEIELVSENGTGYLGITDKYIVYNVENEEGTDYVTYIMDLDGKNARPILENTRLYSVNVSGNYIYYTNADKQICRVKIDGTNQSIICDTTAYNMNVLGNHVYYLNYTNEETMDTVAVYRVKTNGSTEEPKIVKELDNYSSFIDVVGKWVIYMDYNETEGFINSVKVDGSEEIRLYTLNYEQYTEDQETDVTTETNAETTEENNTVTNEETTDENNTQSNENITETNKVEDETAKNTTTATNTVENEVTENTNTSVAQ